MVEILHFFYNNFDAICYFCQKATLNYGKIKRCDNNMTSEYAVLMRLAGFVGSNPLTSESHQDILQGGLFAAIHGFVKESFNSELNQLKMGGHTILFKRSKNLLGSIVLTDQEGIDQ